MKRKFFLYALLVAFIATFSFTGCKDDTTEVEVDEYALLSDYMKANNMDLDKLATSFVVGAPADSVASIAFLAGKHVIDIRSAADFAAGHVNGAINVPFANILTEAAKATKPILVVCYTGQTATYASTLLRMYGKADAAALKWGMSGWNAKYDKWTANCKDLTTSSNWNTTAIEASTYGSPTISTGQATGDAILKARVEAIVAAGFKSIAPADVLASPSNYYVNNYISEAHYTGFGHVAGAVRIQPLLLADNSIKKLNPAKEIVSYCYTGQTSGVVSAWLNVLGYNAKSMLWGLNGVTTSNPFWNTPAVITNHWGFDSKPKSLPTVK
jgi:rhodanese-related sulfurtransferase